jgi:hypothetical protein
MARRTALVLCTAFAVAAVAASCGGSGAGGGGGGGGSSPPLADAGSPGGGAPDAGPADAGGGTSLPPDAGEVVPPAPDGGVGASGAPDAGPAPGGPVDGGTAGAGAPDAGAPSPCDGLLPGGDLGQAARELVRDLQPPNHCTAAGSDPAGQLALAETVGNNGPPHLTIHLYQPSGAPVGDVAPAVDTSFDFHPTASGYQGLALERVAQGARAYFSTWDRSGRQIARGQDDAIASAPDGRGGSAVLERTRDAAGHSGPVKLSRVDDRGVYGASATLDDPDASMLIVNWDTGHALVLTNAPSATRGRWFDAGGAALTDWFAVAGPLRRDGGAMLRLLLDGRVALYDGQRWAALLADGQARVDAVPGWLADRPGTRLAAIRAGRGYAVLPNPPPGGRASWDAFEVVAADGTSCGTVQVPASHPADGSARGPAWLGFGEDGTLLQISDATGAALGPPGTFHCALRWWPALMR